jgi:NADPH:quinone reductase-like Zn-dependent oxidoreductase
VAGAGSVPELVAITGSPDRVITIADFGAGEHGVRISWSGPRGGPSARHGLAVAAELAGKGEFHVDLRAVFPLRQASDAHAMAEAGHGHGKIVLTIP